MFLELAAAVAVATSSTTAGASAKPLRQVVYKVGFSHRMNQTQETFPGMHSDPFGSNISVATDSGTVTVDVMQVANDALGVKVTESWTQGTSGRPMSYTGNVAADGTVTFPPNSISDVVWEILPLFGPRFAQGTSFDSGVAWSLNFDRADMHATTRYTVKDISGDIVVLDKTEEVKVSRASSTGYVGQGTLRFKPSLLVPVSGDIEKRASADTPSSSTQKTLDLHFQMLSDTREAAAAAH